LEVKVNKMMAEAAVGNDVTARLLVSVALIAFHAAAPFS